MAKKVRISGDIRVAFVIEVDAESVEAGDEIVAAMSYREIEAQGNIDTATAQIEIQDGEEL